VEDKKAMSTMVVAVVDATEVPSSLECSNKRVDMWRRRWH
jgi:hypothetical protein